MFCLSSEDAFIRGNVTFENFSYLTLSSLSVSQLVIELIFFQDFYKHYTNCQKPEKGSSDALPAERTFNEQIQIFKEIWPLGVSVWGVFAVTLGAFPALCVKIISSSEDYTWSRMSYIYCILSCKEDKNC